MLAAEGLEGHFLYIMNSSRDFFFFFKLIFFSFPIKNIKNRIILEVDSFALQRDIFIILVTWLPECILLLGVREMLFKGFIGSINQVKLAF